METRKKYVALNQALYEQIKRLLQKESVRKIVEITGMGKSQIYKIKYFIETNPEACAYADFSKKKGPRPKNKSKLENKVREISGRDNSLTQLDINKILETEGIHISASTICRVMKPAGLTRKCLKKKLLSP